MESKRLISRKLIAPLQVAVGMVIIVVAFLVATNRDMNKAQGELLKTVEYMKEQCNDSGIRDLASEAKSLLRVTESVEQVRWRLEYGKDTRPLEQIDGSMLENWAKDCYMDGLVLLDEQGEVRAGVDFSGLGYTKVLDLVDKSALMDTRLFREKSYALRVFLEDEAHLDIAAVGQVDEKGVVVGYFYTSSEYARTINNSIRAIVSGFASETNGTIAISNGNQIVVSNDLALEGTNVEDTLVLKRIMERGTGNKLIHAKNDKKAFGNCFGLMDKSKDYYIYAFMDERQVFSSTIPSVVYVLLAYLIVLSIFDTLWWRTDKTYKEKQMLAQKDYMEKLEEKNRQLEAAVTRAEKANAAKSNFLSRMSHDIRTPLNGIIGLLKIDEDHFEDKDLIRENHKKMRVSANHLMSLINDVLQMSKIEDGNTSLTHERVNMVELGNEIVAIIKGRAIEAGIEWKYNKETSPLSHLYVYGSPVHLRQIFLNIYGNCIKYNRPGGSIMTTVEKMDTHDGKCVCRWTITDTGVGMSEEFLSHIYEPFVQEKEDARSVYHGTGLGMAIVKGLLDQMGGRIEVTSKEGVGSSFVVTIPFELAPEPEKKKRAMPTKKATIEGLHLMLVEDNELNAEIAQMFLSDEKATVTTVSDGKQAVELFEASPAGTFDAILMDIMMPVMDGLTATRTIRALARPDAKTIPIIAMTANAFKEDEQKCLAAGMNAHLAKPLEIEKVKRTIQQQVSLQKAQKNP